MCRQRIIHNDASIVASSDYQRVKASRAILREGHQKRMEAIKKMDFKVTNPSVKHNYQRAYVVIWGKKMYIPKDKVEATIGCGMKVYYE